MIFVCLMFLFSGAAQTGSPASKSAQNSVPSPPDELSRRLQSAIEARNSGDPDLIAKATQRVIALALAEMARLRLDQKAYREASSLCEESLEFEDTAETRVEVAIASLYDKNFSEAVKQASKAAEMDPQSTLAWTIEGEAFLRNEDYRDAATAFNRALDIKQDAESLYGLGTAHLGMDDKKNAEASFTQFLAIVGDFGWSRVLVGRAYQGQALAEEAQQQYRKALLLDPSTPNAHYLWAISLMQANGWSPDAEVYSHFRAELKINPRHFEANYMLGSLASTSRSYNESDKYLHLASEVKPLEPETWVLLGLNAQSRKANRAAEAYFRRAIDLTRNVNTADHLEVRKAYIGLGRLLMASGKTREGEEFLKKARELQVQALVENQRKFAARKEPGEKSVAAAVRPYIPQSDSDRGPSLSPPSTGGSITKEARPATAQAVTRPPSDVKGKTEKHLDVVLGSSLSDLATAEALQEKYDLAWKHYHEADGWDPHIPGLQRNLGLAAYFANQPAEAIRLLSKVVAESPGDAHARAVLGLAYCTTQDFPKAARTIAPIADEAIEDPQLGLAWAKSLAETGDKAKATHQLKTIEKASQSPSVKTLIQIGQLWQELGESERAAQSFRRALLIDPENDDAKCGLHLAKCP
ncbi:MAG TPA: tetratricopeptide repeat protein [Candidatus Acidoferrum sp.]|nr:tetratricopeptide repeat protein [Candidatus Acidoferrum sp.]